MLHLLMFVCFNNICMEYDVNQNPLTLQCFDTSPDGSAVLGCFTLGSDSFDTFNISAVAALVTAAAGAKVVKPLYPKPDDKCSDKDFLDALGIPVCKSLDAAAILLNINSICFIDTTQLPEMFGNNALICNASFCNHKFFGVCTSENAEKLVENLESQNLRHSMIVNATVPNLNKISLCSETNIYDIKNACSNKYKIKPGDFGIKNSDMLSLRGATPQYNANLVTDIFTGKHKGAKTDVIALNAGAMLYTCEKAKSLTEGIMLAYRTIDSKKALQKIEELKKISFF